MSARAEFVGITLLDFDLDAGILRLELALADGAVATTWWLVEDLNPRAVGIAFATLDHEDGFLRIEFVLRDGERDLQRWSFDRLRGFVAIRANEQATPARVLN